MDVSRNSTQTAPAGLVGLAARGIAALEAFPYSLLALPARLAIATVFWRSGTTKIASWDSTLFLFEEEYQVPILPPELAAQMATAIELAAPPLLIAGLLTRATALGLLGMTAVIQAFVLPAAWPVHLLWATLLLILLTRGPGRWSLDGWLRRRILS